MSNALKNGHLPERKGWAYYRRVNDSLKILKDLTKTCYDIFLVLIWSEYMCYFCVYFRIIIFSFLLMFFSFFPNGILYIPSSVLLYVFRFNFSFCVNNGLEKKEKRGRVELFTGGWVSCCWIHKRDDAENEKNDYKTNKENRKGKYKDFVWCNLMNKKVFSFSVRNSL